MKREDCTVQYDSTHKRLVYFGSDADEDYWDEHWADKLSAKDIRRADPFVVKWTKRHLPHGGKVLDAGCGLANTVWGLQQAGYEATGLDYAKQTVAVVNRLTPELNVIEGDVHSLPFEDADLDAIWSLGVIEHFPAGYDQILAEMWRALKPGGLAFVTVPSMSPLRRLKARSGAYPPHTGSYNKFYQFVLHPNEVVCSFENAGWTAISSTSRGGFKGLKDEAGPLRPPLQRFYDLKTKPARYLRAGLNRLLAPISYHTKLYIFRKD